MKPIKLTIDEPRDYIAVGLVLNEIKDYLNLTDNDDGLKETKEISIGADLYTVKIENQDRQIKINISAKQTFDDVYNACMGGN